jgi:hypothetical protein
MRSLPADGAPAPWPGARRRTADLAPIRHRTRARAGAREVARIASGAQRRAELAWLHGARLGSRAFGVGGSRADPRPLRCPCASGRPRQPTTCTPSAIDGVASGAYPAAALDVPARCCRMRPRTHGVLPWPPGARARCARRGVPGESLLAPLAARWLAHHGHSRRRAAGDCTSERAVPPDLRWRAPIAPCEPRDVRVGRSARLRAVASCDQARVDAAEAAAWRAVPRRPRAVTMRAAAARMSTRGPCAPGAGPRAPGRLGRVGARWLGREARSRAAGGARRSVPVRGATRERSGATRTPLVARTRST